MSKPTLPGLSGLANIRPSSAAAEPEPAPRRAAEDHGFIDREPPAQRKRRRGSDEPTVSFTARVAVRDVNAFIEWCERERFSYREGFARLVSRIGG